MNIIIIMNTIIVMNTIIIITYIFKLINKYAKKSISNFLFKLYN